MAIAALTIYALVVIGIFALIGWVFNSKNPDPHGILFQPRDIHPGHRLGEFRRKRSGLEPQRPEGNEVTWKFCRVNKETDCDHVYFPVMAGDEPLGQQCSLCGKFNSLESLQAEWSRRGLS